MERERGGRPRYPGVLTPAEQRVLDALRDGGSNAEIAARLGISRETVKTHIASMLSKVDLSSRHELASWRPERPRRGASGWLALLVRPTVGFAAATGIVAVIVIFAIVIGASRVTVTVSPAPDVNLEGCSGVAVTNPGANTKLVADCESLLGLRDTIRGAATLDWTGSRAMSDWMGVTVSGTPQRVTALNLADLGLDGELSGLLGNLTGLTTLDLSGNDLTGRLPSKLTLMTNLTSVTLDSTFEGCAPSGLTTASGLTACGAPTDTWSIESGDALPAGTYEFDPGTDEPTVVFDVPEDSGLLYQGARHIYPQPGRWKNSTSMMIFANAEQTAWISVDLGWVSPGSLSFTDGFTSTGTESGHSRANFEAIYRQISESIWERAD